MRAGDSRVLGGNQPASSIIYMGPAVRLRLSPHLEGTHLASRIPKVTILFLIAGTLALPAWSAELVMVNSRACFYCARFQREVGRTYDESEAGQIAPLRKIDRLRKWPQDLSAVTPAYYTPVFILVDDGREIGRFPGYLNSESFWSRLKPLLAHLDRTK
jgi:hypothetical protein